MSKHKVPPAYGGQAVVEGVMFGGKHHYVTAIRRTDGSIDFFKLPRKHNPKLNIVKRYRFYGGSRPLSKRVQTAQSIWIFQANVTGSIHLKTRHLSRKKKILWAVYVSQPRSYRRPIILFSKFVFTLVPVFLAELTRPIFSLNTAQIAIESLFKLILLLGYIYFCPWHRLLKECFNIMEPNIKS